MGPAWSSLPATAMSANKVEKGHCSFGSVVEDDVSRARAREGLKRAASREIDEHPETLKTRRRSAIGTRDRAIIGNRSALMDRYRGFFPLRSLFFLFYPSLQMTWKNVEEDEEEEKEERQVDRGEEGAGERGGGEEVAEKRES